jgi:hypothetical protein
MAQGGGDSGVILLAEPGVADATMNVKTRPSNDGTVGRVG